MNHTPMPWKQGYKDNQVIYSDYHQIAVISCREKAWQENAEFIVRACNAHEELVEALKKAFDQIEASKSYGPCLESAKNIIREALAKAGY